MCLRCHRWSCTQSLPNMCVCTVRAPFATYHTYAQGFINTEPVPADNAAAVFAIFDNNRKLQYIGFSKGMEQSLRTVFTRRPDKAYFWKCATNAAVPYALLDVPTQGRISS